MCSQKDRFGRNRQWQVTLFKHFPQSLPYIALVPVYNFVKGGNFFNFESDFERMHEWSASVEDLLPGMPVMAGYALTRYNTANNTPKLGFMIQWIAIMGPSVQ